MEFSAQITTVSIFTFQGMRAKFWAFAQMGLAPLRLGKVQGLRFVKFLGSGADNGFGLMPNFSTYGILAVWENEHHAQQFFQHNALYADYQRYSKHIRTVFLRNNMAHGLWDGQNPFETGGVFDPNAPVAVLTRATIRRRHLWRFWRQVPVVSHAIAGKPGLRFAIGIGELPFVQQATFSVWDSGKMMMDFAYKSQQHASVIRQTRALGWYKEELFARFELMHKGE